MKFVKYVTIALKTRLKATVNDVLVFGIGRC
jgi:hypothetical protein